MSSGTDKIISSIMSEAKAKADVIISEAQVEVNSINQNAEVKAEAEKNKVLDNGKKQSDMRYQQIISEAKMNARRAVMGAKEEIIEIVFDEAVNNLTEIASSNDQEYVDSLANMIKEAAEELGGGELIISMKKEDEDKIKDKLSEIAADVSSETTFTIGEPIETIGGAILKTKNGDIEVNNTIEARLSRFKKLLRSEVANVLFSIYFDIINVVLQKGK